jgi:restriction system protein
LHAIAQAQREAERNRKAQLHEMERAQNQAARAAEKARKDYERAVTADQKERDRLYTESRIAQVNYQNEQLEQQIKLLEHLLRDALSADTYIDVQRLKQTPNLPPFNPGQLAIGEPPPRPEMYMPPPPTGIQKLLPGAKEKYAQEVAKAQEAYRAHVAAHSAREMARQQALAQLRAQHERQIAEERERVTVQHAEIDSFHHDLIVGAPHAIVDYYTMVLAASSYPSDFPQHMRYQQQRKNHINGVRVKNDENHTHCGLQPSPYDTDVRSLGPPFAVHQCARDHGQAFHERSAWTRLSGEDQMWRE